ncbi:hypothetical protein BKP44_18205 [Formosa algae]|nr:hypothetical protein BKP44_18205 [Formosa algae]
MCPEVNLFDSYHSFNLAKGLACTNGTWDIELRDKFESLENKHFSECLEFSNYSFENTFNGIKKKASSQNDYCYTYLMVNRENGRHKIGISKTPKFREKTLMSSEPKIETVCTRKFITRQLAKNLENELHDKYAEFRKRGEWFDLKEVHVNEIIKILSK